LSGFGIFLLELLEVLGRGFRKGGFGVGLELAHEVGDSLFDSGSHYDDKEVRILGKKERRIDGKERK
jgi:hypothetical protein